MVAALCDLAVAKDVDLATVCENPKELTFASCCRKMRWISNCYVRTCYDTSYHFCKEGKGCKKSGVEVNEFIRRTYETIIKDR